MELNKIYLGDCMELIKEIPDKSIDLIVTDPPYDIGTSHGSGIYRGKTNTHLEQLEKLNINKGFDYNLLKELVRVMKKINIYIYCNKKQVPIYLKFFEALKTSYDFLLWEKENPAPMCGTHYLVDKEYCLYFWEAGAPVHIPYERGKTIYRSKTNVADKEIYKHPTIKNIEMVETLILNSSQPGGGYIRSVHRFRNHRPSREKPRAAIYRVRNKSRILQNRLRSPEWYRCERTTQFI